MPEGNDFLFVIYRLFDALLSPLRQLIFPGEKACLIYLTCAAALAAGVYLARARRRRLSALLAFCFPLRLFRHNSAIADYKIWFTNSALIVLILPALSVLSLSSAASAGLRSLTGLGGLHLQGGVGVRLLYTAIDFLALDAGLFFAHYAQHKFSVLWQFHKTHHSAQVLTPITVFRMHPVDLVLNYAATGALAGMASGVFLWGFDGVSPATVYGINAVEFAFLILGYHLRHSHVWLMFPGWIGRHISSPALHLIHHSKDPRHFDKNMAQLFTFWDRMFGTLYLPTARETLTFGLANDEDAQFQTLRALYTRPFRNLLSRE